MKQDLGWSILFLVLISFGVSCQKNKSLPQPVILGHAGVALSTERALYPPNSEESINYAVNAFNADGVELDVQMTQDSILVLYHDESITIQKGESTCIYQLNWKDIELFNAELTHPIIQLEDVANELLNQNKYLFLDLKFYDYCDSSNVDLAAMASRLITVFEGIDPNKQERLVFNTRNIDLIDLIPVGYGIRSFETDDIDLGIEYYDLGKIDMISTRLNGFLESEKVKMKNASIPFSLFSIKTRKEIETAASFTPDYVITDNIPATRKFYN